MTRIVIVMEGGLVQAVLTDNHPERLEIAIVDYDSDGADADEISALRQHDDAGKLTEETADACLRGEDAGYQPAFVAHVFETLNAPAEEPAAT